VRSTEELYETGQSLWLDNITRGMLDSGQLRTYIEEYSITGLTSNPSIYDHAIKTTSDYDVAIREKVTDGKKGEELFFELALEDLRRAADLFRAIHDATGGVDGWVSLEVSPLLAYDPEGTVTAAVDLFTRAGRPNLFIKIPGVKEGLPAVEEAIYRGVPVNVTLLFDADHYLAAAEAYMRGLERRHEEGKPPVVGSVASVFMSRWDAAVNDRVGPELHDRLSIAIGRRTYRGYRELRDSDRWQRLLNVGARPQRLLWASTSTKDPTDEPWYYVHGLGAPFTINTMPEVTLRAFAERGEVGEPLSPDGGDADEVLARFADAGIDVKSLAGELQEQAARAFVDSWHELMGVLEARSADVMRAT
jgi:transaldolase